MTKQTITFLIVLFFFYNYALCHSGKIAVSYPLSEIKIDGNLSDWPESIKKYQINNFLGGVPNQEAYFQTGYDLSRGILYVAVTVFDDKNVFSNENDNIFWNPEDKQFLYLDPEHSRNKGSGVLTIGASQSGVKSQKVRSEWDTYNNSFTKSNVKVNVYHKNGKTAYEWAVELGQSIQEYKSIGLDFLIFDHDGTDIFHTNSVWSEGGAKRSIPSRLGDLLLLPTNEQIGSVKGNVKWTKEGNDKLPIFYKVQSTSKQDFWTVVTIDSINSYTATLPFGNYSIKPFQKVNNEYSFNDKVRINEHSKVAFTISKETTVIEDTLLIKKYDSPKFLIPQKGIFFEKEFDPEQVDAFVSTYKEFCNVTGLSLAVIKDGEIVYNKHFGHENTITQKPVNSTSIFEIASVSKTVFAFAINRLADKKIIDLDKSLYKYLEFDQLSDDDRAKSITARHILSHQSGLPNWVWGGPFGSERGDKTKLLFSPGTKYQYSGEGYEYLKRVIEKITKKDIQTIIQEEVYLPLGMVKSSFTATPQIEDKIIVGHTENIPMFWNLHDRAWISGSMYSTSKDMAVFMKALMDEKELSPNAYNEMFESQIINEKPWIHYFGGYEQSHSLGFEIEKTPYGRIIHHGGNNGDFQARFAMNWEKKNGFVLLTNNNNGFKLDLILQEFFFSGRLPKYPEGKK